MDVGFLQGGQSFVDRLIDKGEKIFEIFSRIDQLYDDGQVFRQTFYLERMHPAVRSETHHSSQDGGSGQMGFARLLDYPFVQGLSFVPVALPDEYPEQCAFLRYFHLYPHASWPTVLPAQTNANPPIT
jgi:hypothetical protein